MKAFQLKRVYEVYSLNDGQRILVDRLWPRGLSKAKAHLDHWLKEIGPSNELRQWFNHDVTKWPEFEKKYWQELQRMPEVITTLVELIQQKPSTLLFSARDENHNNAVALKHFLTKHYNLRK